MAKPNLKKIKDCFGPGPEMLFAMDSESEPGIQLMHFVRFKTLRVKNSGVGEVPGKNFNEVPLGHFGAGMDEDPRIEVFFQCVGEDGKPQLHVLTGKNVGVKQLPKE